MNRREFLHQSTIATGLMASNRPFAPFASFADEASPVQVNVHTEQVLGVIPPDFIGLGYEISSVARHGLLSANNHVYAQLVRALGRQGVLRVGGNTADYASYSRDGKAVSAPKSTLVNQESLEELGSFLHATGWKLIWGLNLGKGTEQDAVEEALSVNSAVKDSLMAFEIGNEVDLFSHEGHRPPGYTFVQYLEEYRRYKAAVRAKLPYAQFAGPDIAGKTDWVTQFAAAEGHDLTLLTHHYYRAGESPASSLEMLLNPDPKLAPILETLRQASASLRVPYRICETNSFSGGGRPGVSGTFGAALWVLDYMFILASADAAGVNMETGVNQRGFVSSYSPIGDNEQGTYTAMPEFYGMLAFAQGSRGERLAVSVETQGVNLTAYAVAQERKRVTVTLINKDHTRAAAVKLTSGHEFNRGTILRLTAPSLESTTGITFGEASVTPDGGWKATRTESLRQRAGTGHILLPAGSAVVVKLTE